MADPGGYRNLQPDAAKAAPIAAGVGIRGCVDDSLCPHGDQRRQNPAIAALQSQEPGTEPVCDPAGGELLLESHFLQSAGFRLCFFLAYSFVGTHTSYDSAFPDNGSV